MEVEEKYKTRAIIAHITLIGWIIALVQNSEDKNEFSSFYIRQMLGLIVVAVGLQIVSMIFAFVPFLGFIISILIFLSIVGIWVMSLIGAVNGKKEPTPFVGQMFQQWFKSM